MSAPRRAYSWPAYVFGTAWLLYVWHSHELDQAPWWAKQLAIAGFVIYCHVADARKEILNETRGIDE